MASTSKVSQANAELACSPRRSGENLPAPSCHSDGRLTPSQSIHLGTPVLGGARDSTVTKMDLDPVLMEISCQGRQTCPQ